MRRLFVICFALTLVAVAAEVMAQDAATPLQGRWVVVDGEHNGKPMNGLNGGVMTVTGSAWEIRTASGNMLKGTLKPDASKKPPQMDMAHAGGTIWEALYETTGDTFRLNYVEKGEKDPRPTGFMTSEKTEESLVVLQRQKQ